MDTDNLQKIRPIDPNVAQRKASDPKSTIWVNASAGTGKTKVLTDRILRLLLPKTDQDHGAVPHKILGITFTKAAANEMLLRLNKKLSHWAITDNKTLKKDLEKLLGKPASNHQIQYARQLFSKVIDAPGGLKIMTIHALCQSILARFPLETKTPVHFTVLEQEEAQDILEQALNKTIKKTEEEKGSPTHQAWNNIVQWTNEGQCKALLKNVISEQAQLYETLNKHFGIDGLYTNICKALNIQTNQTPDIIKKEFCKTDSFDHQSLKHACEIMTSSGTKTDASKAEIINTWLAANETTRASSIESYKSFALKKDNDPKKSLITKSLAEKYPVVQDTLEKESIRIQQFFEHYNASICAHQTYDLILFSHSVLKEYQTLKHHNASLDFDDLIIKTKALLSDEDNSQSWVMYKMDQGIDHILVDEAQDTNPDQWSIIEALCSEFFTGISAQEEKRTLFVVGDEKQSIYAFQRASPEKFFSMKNHIAQKVKDAEQKWDDVDLNVSFRTSQTILDLVDRIFEIEPLQNHTDAQTIRHQSFRIGQEGVAELWPLFQGDEKEEFDPWTSPFEIRDTQTGSVKCANFIAEKIESWIKNKDILPSRNRPIRAGDIMILLRTRNAFTNHITRALKNKNIPVSGSDRMIINNELAVEDILTLIEFTLLPHDDLNLAGLLKSPFINLSEEALYDLCIDRPSSIWERIQDSNHNNIIAYLQNKIEQAKTLNPFEFISNGLQTPCPANKKSGMSALKSRLGDDITDPIQELLNSALNFENKNSTDLQSFVHWQKSQNQQIKRELENNHDAVKIMTVHGAKGLQAPIVICPDTTRTIKSPPGQVDNKMLWPNKTDLSIPLFSAQAKNAPALFKTAQDKIERRMDSEYNRLLYVALTRAEDRLYITGYRNQKEPLEQSWYNSIKTTFKNNPETQEIEGDILRLYNPQTKSPDREEESRAIDSEKITAPAWLHKKLEQATHCTPHTNDPINSPLIEQTTSKQQERGIIMHQLLEILPSIPQNQQNEKARQIVKDNDDAQNIINQALDIIHNPNLAHLFGSNSKTEVPIAATLPNGDTINGRIDRLIIEEQKIIILDYKTGARPKTQHDIPQPYIDQLTKYKAALTQIYPEHTIETALLWTDHPSLMPIEINTL